MIFLNLITIETPFANPSTGGDTTACCKINLGIGLSADDCDDDSCKQSGACDLRLALDCGILGYTKTACPDEVITDIQMNDTTNNPTDGDDENAFYLVGTKTRTLGMTFTWTCNTDTKNKVYNETITGEITNKTPRIMCALRSYMCKEVVAALREFCDNGAWYALGLGGGFELTQVTGGTGVLANDNNNTVITLSGAELSNPFCTIDAGSVSDTEMLIDSVTSTAV